MKLPTQAAPTVAPRPISGGDVTVGAIHGGSPVAKGLMDLAEGVGAAGRGGGQLATSYEREQDRKAKEQERLQKEAYNKAVLAQGNEALAGAQDDTISLLQGNARTDNAKVMTVTRDANTGEPLGMEAGAPQGFLQLRGADASRQSADALDALDKIFKDREESLSTPEAKEWFREHARTLHAASRRDIEAHTAQQNQVALQDSVKVSQDSARRALAANPMSPDVADIIKRPESATAALALPGDADNAVMAWRGQAAAVRLDALIANKDYRNAETVLKEAGDTLPPKAREAAEKQIAGVKMKAQGDELAAKAIDRATGEDGRVDVDKAVAEVTKATEGFTGKDGQPVETDESMRQFATSQVLRRARVKEQQWNAETKDVRRKAGAQFNTGGFASIPEPLLQELNKRDPDYYRRLRDYEENQRLRRARGAADYDKVQERINRDALRAYNAHSPEERASMDVPTEFAATGVNKSGMDLILGHQQTDVQRLKTHGERETSFVNEVVNEAAGRRQVNGKPSDVNTRNLRSEATEAFQNWVTENKGALPSTKDAELIKAQLLQKQLVPRFGDSIIGPGQKPQWQINAEKKQKGQQPGPKPSKVDRAKALKAQGKSLKEIADTLNAEGY
jgi:hypothetical protein